MRTESDSGMTVIELLIAMLLLLVIMAPLSIAFIIGLQTTMSSEQDAGNSADTQLLGSFFDDDVASAQTVVTATAAVTCGEGDGLLELRWTDGAVKQHVAYEVQKNVSRADELQVSDVYDLRRVVCSDGAGTVVDTKTVARTLAQVPEISCDPHPCTSTPRTITLLAKAHSTQMSDEGGASLYTFGITATRKVLP